MINANRLDTGFMKYQKEYEQAAIDVLRSGWYVLGKQVEAFEKEFAAYLGSAHCVGLDNGLNALKLAFRALDIGEGDEVIVQANTYIASVMGISMNRATPVPVETDEYYGIDPEAVKKAITDKTKAVLVVHLYGHTCRMDAVMGICREHGLKLVEDCAQSHGSTFDNRSSGTFGDIGCFSFYPTKNLGAFGDGGAIVTDNEDLDKKIRILRNYGSQKRYYNEVVGENSRLDEIQAALLRVKLSHMDELNAERDEIAKRYNAGINNPLITLPPVSDRVKCVWHQYVIRCDKRDELAEYLRENGIGTIIHYPIPPHLSQAYEYLGYKKGDFPLTERYADTVLSIPMFNGMTQEEQDMIIDRINGFK